MTVLLVFFFNARCVFRIFLCLTSSFTDDDFFFGGGPLPDDKPNKPVKQVSAGPGQGKVSRVTGRLQVRVVLLYQ